MTPLPTPSAKPLSALLVSALLVSTLLVSTQFVTLPANAASASGLWLPPLGLPLRISQFYDLSRGPYAAGHRGIDLRATDHDPVVAPANGTVSFSGTVVDRPVLSIRVDEHTVVSFEPVSSELQAGDAVARGQPIGTVASGGHCATACLHLGARVDDAYVNPMRFFKGRPALVPW